MHAPAEFLSLSPEVAAAVATGQPLVALESTIISHGMPYPQNLETALRIEREIRSGGAIPATIAILNGKLKAGLTAEELQFLALEGPAISKCSRRDLPVVLAQQGHGATTVAATMIIAEMAGIRVFATGGIGGVHRGAQDTMDISADLQELSKTNVAVVSAGAKAILDIGLTLEYLETMGVPVIGYQTDRFPAFYLRDSGFGVSVRCNTPEAVAAILNTKWQMGLQGGILIANPIPAAFEMAYARMQAAIDQAIGDADAQQVRGKAITPFLLSRIVQLTEGESLKSNIELVLNNARLATGIAHALRAASKLHT